MSVVCTTPLYKEDNAFIKAIDLADAQNYNNTETHKFPAFYECSGLKNFIERTFKLLDKELFPIESIFIENSTITTATEEGVLSAFTAFWEEQACASRAKEVFQTQQKVIKYLQKNLVNLFWHPDFFIAPNKSLAYYSFIDQHQTAIIGPEIEQIINDYEHSHHKISTNKFQIEEEKKNNIFGLNSFFEMNYTDIINIKSTGVRGKGIAVKNLHLINHRLYHKHFQPDRNHQKPSVFLSIPILCPYASGIKAIEGLKGKDPIYPGLGAVFVFLIFKKEIPDLHSKKVLETKLKKLIKYIFLHAKDYASYYSFSSAYLKAEQVKEQATKAAISQVMARNMSHNIGSHVLSKFVTKQEVEAVITADSNSKPEMEPYKPYPGLNEKDCNHEKMAWFNSYLRNRMDYLADIATGVPAMEVTRQLVADIIAGFDKNRILLNRISGTENFSYSLEVRDCRLCPGDCTAEVCLLDGKNKDVPVSIPNDVMGYHALYIMIENLIRNTAKHGGQKNNQHTKFILEIRNSPVDKSMYEAILYDNVQRTGEYTLTDNDKQFYRLQCENPDQPPPNNTMTETDWLVYKQNVHLNESVLDEQNKLRHGAWGLIEMDVSAAYLRKLSPEQVDRTEYTLDVANTKKRGRITGGKSHLNLLKAVNKDNCLGYRFHLAKPKEMIIIDEKGELWQELQENDSLNVLNEYGIQVLHTNAANALDPDQQWLFDKEKVYPYPFMLIIPGNRFLLNYYLYKQVQLTDDNETIRIANANLPTRIIVQGTPAPDNIKNQWVAWCNKEHALFTAISNKVVKRDNIFTDDTIIDHAWKIWLANKFNCFGIDTLFNQTHRKYIGLPDEGIDLKAMLDDHGRNIKKYMSQYQYYETYTSLTRDLVENRMEDIIDDKPNPYFDKSEIFKFMDGVFTNIFVFDERVQQNAITYDYANLNIIKHLKKARILVPEKEIKLNNTSFEKGYLDDIKKFIQSATNKELAISDDIVVIHLGIIEKILEAEKKGKTKSDILRFINELNSIAQPGALKIVITSGRGKPDNLPSEIPFIGYSILSQYCIENRFKSFFNQAIQSARPLN